MMSVVHGFGMHDGSSAPYKTRMQQSLTKVVPSKESLRNILLVNGGGSCKASLVKKSNESGTINFSRTTGTPNHLQTM